MLPVKWDASITPTGRCVSARSAVPPPSAGGEQEQRAGEKGRGRQHSWHESPGRRQCGGFICIHAIDSRSR
jgi:hypothetical protein